MNRQHSRRAILKQLGIVGALAGVPGLMVSCGGDDEDEAPTATVTGPSVATATEPAASAETTPPEAAATAQPLPTATAAQRNESRGELRVAEPFLPAALDSDVGSAGNLLQALGVSESLMRFSPELTAEPWIAASLEQVDLTTWQLTLRDDVTFWDGSPVDAEAVRASLLRTMELQPGTADLLPPESALTADGLVLTIETPLPMGLMAFNLAAANLGIKKAVTDDEILYTGPFTVTSFTARESINLEAYPGYRGGPPRLEAISARQVSDVAARSLALQAGEVDIAQALLPSDVGRLEAGELTIYSAPWARQHMVVFNLLQPPLDDVAVRRAFSLAIDREALRDGVMDGVGEAAYGIAPEDIGLRKVIRTQAYDPAEAQRIMDEAGWLTGSEGIREKDGQKLAVKLGTYAGRAELEQFAVVMLDMLRAVGIQAEIEKYEDVEVTLTAAEHSATTYSIGSAAFGDVSRLLGTLYMPSSRQKTYDNPEVTRLYGEYLIAGSDEEREGLFVEMQELIGEDVPVVYLFNPYQVVGASSEVTNFAPHPLDSYKYNAATALDG